MHRLHPNSTDPSHAVLFDDCYDCEDMAKAPWRYLDNSNLEKLVIAATAEQRNFGRTHNEGVAIANIINTIDHMGKLMEVALVDIVIDLQKRWSVRIAVV